MLEPDIDKLVNERISHWTKMYKDHFPVSAGLDLIILKSHLLIEQQMTALICHYCHSPNIVPGVRLSFTQKTSLSRALLTVPLPEHFWKVLDVMNRLRNDLAHNLEPPKLQQYLLEAKDIAIEIAKAKNSTTHPSKLNTDELVITYLVSYTHGFLSGIDSLIAVMEKQKRQV